MYIVHSRHVKSILNNWTCKIVRLSQTDDGFSFVSFSVRSGQCTALGPKSRSQAIVRKRENLIECTGDVYTSGSHQIGRHEFLGGLSGREL